MDFNSIKGAFDFKHEIRQLNCLNLSIKYI